MINVLYVVTSCKKVGPIQQLLNMIMNLDRAKFRPYLMTLYDDACDKNSQLEKFKPYLAEHFFIPMSKVNIMIGSTTRVRTVVEAIKPDVIHTLGVFPDYLISRMKCKNHVTTLRNYMFDDFTAKFGLLRGGVLSLLQLLSLNGMKRVWVCSKSLTEIYKRKLGMEFPFIQNGIDTEFYCVRAEEKQSEIRRMLSLPEDKFIYVYSGEIGRRKNQSYLADVFSGTPELRDRLLIFLGNGPLLSSWKEKYAANDNIMFVGEVKDVRAYLKAADVYLSSSLSEGLPNGVLEAMAMCKAVILSDIPQHREVLCGERRPGEVFPLDNPRQCKSTILSIDKKAARTMGENARKCVEVFFSAKVMSRNYQKEYIDLVERE